MNGLPGYSGSAVNPVLAQAIESTRRYLAASIAPAWDFAPRFSKRPAQKLPVVDSPDQLVRWQGDSRASVLNFELISGLQWRKEARGGTLEFDGKDLVTMVRPESRDVLVAQARVVAERAADRCKPRADDLALRDRLPEIGSQVVPPMAFFCAALPMHPDRMPRTIELINLTLFLASLAAQRFKHAMAVPRPHEINPQVFPAILTPAHASLPSGHSTEAFAVAGVLGWLLGSNTDLATWVHLRRLAFRIADNREVAGLHYPMDSIAGKLLGSVLADFIMARSLGGYCSRGRFRGDKLDGSERTNENGAILSAQHCEESRGPKLAKSALLEWLWQAAEREWGAT